MENEIREYVYRKLAVYPNTGKMLEFREKLVAMMLYIYNDCQYYGMSKEKSYSQAILAMNHYSQNEKYYPAKLSDGLLTSCHLYGGIA